MLVSTVLKLNLEIGKVMHAFTDQKLWTYELMEKKISFNIISCNFNMII